MKSTPLYWSWNNEIPKSVCDAIIEEGLKLDFHNVLIRPKRSTINSRNNVNLQRNFNFYSFISLILEIYSGLMLLII